MRWKSICPASRLAKAVAAILISSAQIVADRWNEIPFSKWELVPRVPRRVG
jgi:hypothetical protein